MHTVHAIFENGVFRPVVPLELPEQAEFVFEPRLVPESVANHPIVSPDGDTARARFEKWFGSVDLGKPIGVENKEIDADLARAYGNSDGST